MKAINTRRDLIAALSAAAHLEHALCCAYLYAGFSLKRTEEEGGVTWPQLKHVRDWTTDLFLIARQEMEHLSMVCNLLTAIGGAPQFRRHNFPMHSHTHGELPALGLEAFSAPTIERFISFETPEYLHLRSELLKGIQGEKQDQALEFVLRRICADACWDYGEIWVPQQSGALECTFAGHLTDRGDPDKRAAFIKTASDRIAEQQNLSADCDLPTLACKERKTQRESVDQGSGFEQARAAVALGMNTAAAIPIIGKDSVVAVLVCYYQTYESLDEDDEMIATVAKAINESPPEASSVADALADLPPVDEGAGVTWGHPMPMRFSTIGGFYRHIRKGFCHLDSNREKPLFIGPDQAQVGIGELELRPGWFSVGLYKVHDLASAKEAIDKIIEEGEGTSAADASGHFERLVAVLKNFEDCLAKDPLFQPARPVVSNPFTDPHAEHGSASTRLSAPLAVGLSRLFNAAYELTLLMLIRFYTHVNTVGTTESEVSLHKLSEVAFLPLMTMAIRPLGELLTTTPAFDSTEPGDEPATAGASFEIPEDLGLLPHRRPAWIFFHERLVEMADDCDRLLQLEGAPQRLQLIGDNLRQLAVNIEALGAPHAGGNN